jgi:hypothetical protein
MRHGQEGLHDTAAQGDAEAVKLSTCRDGEIGPTGFLLMDMVWEVYGLPLPVGEFRFHPERRWRADYCWPDKKVIVEIEGGVWSRGRHTRGYGFVKDMEKYNEAGKLGYRVFRFTPQQLKMGLAQDFMKQVLE